MGELGKSGVWSPNQECWDQRIPNEQLLDRNFQIMRGPSIMLERPINTSACGRVPRGGDHPKKALDQQVVVSTSEELIAATYWKGHGRCELPQSLLTPAEYKVLLRKYPGRPWLHGITRDAWCESARLWPAYNPKDCLPRLTDDPPRYSAGLDSLMKYTSVHMSPTGQMWNENTSQRARQV